MTDFVAFPKIARFNRDVVVTEKIDGTNAQICINMGGEVFAGSRNRWIQPGNDNFGFAAWVEKHCEELLALGPGRHFGEWWGQGIGRRYDQTEKHFSLFNVGRWYDDHTPQEFITEKMVQAPICCRTVPVLATGTIEDATGRGMDKLRHDGSQAAPGFERPEGVITFHTGNGAMFKHTFEQVHGKHAA